MCDFLPLYHTVGPPHYLAASAVSRFLNSCEHFQHGGKFREDSQDGTLHSLHGLTLLCAAARLDASRAYDVPRTPPRTVARSCGAQGPRRECHRRRRPRRCRRRFLRLRFAVADKCLRRRRALAKACQLVVFRPAAPASAAVVAVAVALAFVVAFSLVGFFRV